MQEDLDTYWDFEEGKEDPPMEIGPYKILGTLGQGGMGTVYLAEQTQPVHRKVALKVINWGMDSETIVARFHSERQALALMNHPFIATVYDAGSTAEGLPFFAMEPCSGEPILKYCDRKKLPAKARLKLFLKVCEGVRHAHQKMVIHRDIKPSNILVGERNGDPEPKLIDFGIAKTSRGTACSKDARLTQDGAPLGTPLYMSPEQVEDQDLDARVDVYGLGVLLYELLVGAAPFDAQNADYYHMLVKVMEEEPPPPSERLTGLGDATQTIVAQRGTDKRSLVRLLRGDLDWIILKAMEKDRNLRYGSVSELKADVERYLCYEPVSAKPRSLAYRTSKFIQRHKLGVFTVFLFLMSLLLGVVGTTYGMFLALDARDQANQSEKRALGTLAYLQGVLASVDPSVEGREMSIADLLGQAVQMVDEDLSDEPLVESSVRKTIGWSYLEMGLYSEAEKQLGRAYELQKQHLGETHLDTTNTYNAMGRLFYKKGRFRDSEEVHRQVFQIEKEALGIDHQTTLWTQYNLAKAIDKQGRFLEAEKLYRDNISRRNRVLGSQHIDTLVANNSLALVLAFDARGNESVILQKKNLHALETLFGEEHPQTINARANLVAIYCLREEHMRAKSLAEETIALQKRILGETHPETLETQTYLAKMLIQIGNLPVAENQLREVLAIQTQTLGMMNPKTIGAMAYLAQAKVLAGEFQEARLLAEQSEEAAIKTLGASHWLAALCTGMNGLSLVGLDRWSEGETKLLAALEGIRPFQHYEKKLIHQSLYENYRKRGEIQKANYYSDSQKL